MANLLAAPLLTLSLLMSATLGRAQADQIDSLARAAQRAFGVPGFAVGVIKDGEVVLSRGYGELELGGGTAVDSATLFAIASNTKAFIGTSVAVLEAEGKLSLEDPVGKFLPYLEWSNPEVTELAIVEDLLTHRTGLGTFEGDHLWFRRDLPAKEVLTSVKTLPLRYPFRAGYGYSNLMFIAAGEVIQEASGLGWDAFLRKRIFTPLGMERTVTSTSQLPAENVASGHVTRQNNRALAAVPWEASGAAGGIWSSVSDMLRWLECNLDRGTFRGDSLWSADVQDDIWRPRNAFGDIDNFASYALGWGCSELAGHGVVSHGGGYDGMYSRVVAVPDQRLGIVVLSNSMTGLPSTLARRIEEMYLGVDTSTTWLEEAVAKEAEGDSKWTTRQDSVDQLLGEYAEAPSEHPLQAGTYRDAVYGDFQVEADGDEFVLNFPDAPRLQAKLTATGGDYYRLTWTDPSAWFDRALAWTSGEDGGVQLRLYVPNDDIFYDAIRAAWVAP